MMNLQPLGDARIQITWTGEPDDHEALFTCRCKDQDLTPEQMLALSNDLRTVALAMLVSEGREG